MIREDQKSDRYRRQLLAVEVRETVQRATVAGVCDELSKSAPHVGFSEQLMCLDIISIKSPH